MKELNGKDYFECRLLDGHIGTINDKGQLMFDDQDLFIDLSGASNKQGNEFLRIGADFIGNLFVDGDLWIFACFNVVNSNDGKEKDINALVVSAGNINEI